MEKFVRRSRLALEVSHLFGIAVQRAEPAHWGLRKHCLGKTCAHPLYFAQRAAQIDGEVRWLVLEKKLSGQSLVQQTANCFSSL